MGKTTRIEYCDSTVNPVVGCTGCELYHPTSSRNHCYAASLCRRMANNKGWPKSFTEPAYFLERLERAIRWSDLTSTDRPDKPWLNGFPRVIFVNDLGDSFCPNVDPDEWLLPSFYQMEESPHIYMLLTKWPDRMKRFFDRLYVPDNFWLGTSVLRKKDYLRIEFLLRIRDARRWLSVEPLLEEIDMGLRNWAYMDGTLIGFVALGGESGHNARPSHPDWFRLVRDDCLAAGVPLFFKQWGEWAHIPSDTRNYPHTAKKHMYPDMNLMAHVGKKRAGRLLDGREWNQMPKIRRSDE